jgi:acetyl-CoA synthetase
MSKKKAAKPAPKKAAKPAAKPAAKAATKKAPKPAVKPAANPSGNSKSLMTENRVFKPSAEFSKQARVSSMAQYKKMYEESIKHPDKFFGREAQELLWSKPFTKVLDWKCPNAKWFVGGKLNVSENCLDRHLDGPRKIQGRHHLGRRTRRKARDHLPAASPRGLPLCQRAEAPQGEERRPRASFTCRWCLRPPSPCWPAHASVPCTASSSAASAAESIKDRVHDSGASLIITADGGYRRGAVVALKKNVDDALKGGDSRRRRVIVFQRTKQDVHIEEGRDFWWHRELEYVDANCPAVAIDAESPLFILYTSGSTGKPKGILHTTGGYLHAQMTCKYVFDLRDDDVYWCTADIGWVTGHSYIVYGPLANRCHLVMYEGAPNWPENDRFWKIIEEYAVTVFYTAPTAIRAFMKWGDEWLKKHDLSSLRLLGTVGEPINPEAWMWYHKKSAAALPHRRYLVADRNRRPS